MEPYEEEEDDDDFIKIYGKKTAEYYRQKEEQIEVAEVQRKLRLKSIEMCAEAEELSAKQDFMNKKNLLFEQTKACLEKKINRVQDRWRAYQAERKLRKEPKEVYEWSLRPRPQRVSKHCHHRRRRHHRAREIRGPYIVYLLKEEEIEEDLKVIKRALRSRDLSPPSRPDVEKLSSDSICSKELPCNLPQNSKFDESLEAIPHKSYEKSGKTKLPEKQPSILESILFSEPRAADVNGCLSEEISLPQQASSSQPLIDSQLLPVEEFRCLKINSPPRRQTPIKTYLPARKKKSLPCRPFIHETVNSTPAPQQPNSPLPCCSRFPQSSSHPSSCPTDLAERQRSDASEHFQEQPQAVISSFQEQTQTVIHSFQAIRSEVVYQNTGLVYLSDPDGSSYLSADQNLHNHSEVRTEEVYYDAYPEFICYAETPFTVEIDSTPHVPEEQIDMSGSQSGEHTPPHQDIIHSLNPSGIGNASYSIFETGSPQSFYTYQPVMEHANISLGHHITTPPSINNSQPYRQSYGS